MSAMLRSVILAAKSVAAGVLFVVLGAPIAFPAVVSLPAQSSPAGGSIILPVSFASEGSSVSAAQFDLEYDSSVISLAIIVGEAVRTSGKHLYVADVSANRKRLIICGLDQVPVPDGVIANLFVNVTASAAAGVYPLKISGLAGADPPGEYTPIDGADGALTVQAAGDVAQLQPAGILNGASLLPGAIAPGEIIALIGSGIGPISARQSGTIRLLFDAVSAPILYAGPNQINAVVPYGISGKSSTQFQLTVKDQVAMEFPLSIVEATPGIFTLDSSGIGPGAILDQDLTVNSPLNPAGKGSVITLLAHGAGQTSPPGTDGQISAGILPMPVLPVSVQIGGFDAKVQYAGAAPGMIAGALQVNCIVPLDAPSGYSVPIVLTVGHASSQAGVTLAIR